MNMGEAIGLMLDHLSQQEPWANPDWPDAIRLLIEAGKCIQRLRQYEYFGYSTELPGETDD